MTGKSESVDTRYLGFTLRITERSIGVIRDGRLLDTVPSMEQARLFVRGWRWAERNDRKTVTA